MQEVPLEPRAYWLLHDGALAFSDIQQHGIKMDVPYLKTQFKKLGTSIKNSIKELDGFAEVKQWKKTYGDKFKLDSDDQLKELLFEQMEYEPSKFTDSGAPSVDQEALHALNTEFTKSLLRYRKYDKLKNTYIKSLLKETVSGHLHPFLNLHTARTFRSSSNLVNIQNQPSRDEESKSIIRQAFRARDGHYLVASDYGGLEVKGACWNCKDPVMIDYLLNPKTADMHADFTKQIFFLESFDKTNAGQSKLRKACKNCFTFPQFYGDYYGNNAAAFWEWLEFKGNHVPKKSKIMIGDNLSIAENLRNNGIKNYKQFTFHIKKIEEILWEKTFRVYKKWRDTQWNEYNKRGYISTLTGFICQGVMDRNAVINYPVQGSAFHCMLKSLIEIHEILKKEKMKSGIIFQVHDEIVSDVAEDEYDDYMAIVREIMVDKLRKDWVFVNVPMELETKCSELNGNWYKMEEADVYIN